MIKMSVLPQAGRYVQDNLNLNANRFYCWNYTGRFYVCKDKVKE